MPFIALIDYQVHKTNIDMKKTIFLLANIYLLVTCALNAQPIITASNYTPNPGEIYKGYYLDTTGLTPGPSGISVSWDFSAFSHHDSTTTEYQSCLSTPFCDSFPGSNLASYIAPNYQYYTTGTGSIIELGQYYPSTYYHVTGGTLKSIVYPFTYGGIYFDAFDINVPAIGQYSHYIDTVICDGYGTILLPSDTVHHNVLRLHAKTLRKDSILHGSVTNHMTENYTWLLPGFHNGLLYILYDTSSYKKYAVYYTKLNPLSLSGATGENDFLDIFPSPTGIGTHLKCFTGDNDGAKIIITDILGRQVGVVNRA